MRAFVLSILSLATVAIPLLAETPTLAVAISQDGTEVPIENGVARIRRAPFDLVVTVPEGDTVRLNAMESRELYDRARIGARIADWFGTYGAAAEGLADENLVVNDAATHHAWWYESPTDYRCGRIVMIDGGFRCTRHIRELIFKDPITETLSKPRSAAELRSRLAAIPLPRAVPVSYLRSEGLNLVLLTGVSDASNGSIFERERAWVRIEFTDPPARAFSIRVLQDGQPIEIQDHVVELRRAPFEIELDAGVLYHAALDSPVIETAKKGLWLGRTFGSRNAGEVPRQSGVLQLWDETTTHGDWAEGRHRIERVALGKASIPIDEFARSSIHLVLYAGEPATENDGGTEYQRDWVELRFRD